MVLQCIADLLVVQNKLLNVQSISKQTCFGHLRPFTPDNIQQIGGVFNEKRVAINVDRSSLRASCQNGLYINKHFENAEHHNPTLFTTF